MNVKVSVILPVYNVENYIEECLDSLIHQTLNDIEIICVDDGSTDGTLEILHRYEAKDSRVKVIRQKNQYAGVARNHGMKHASGKYMIFLDSDDFFEQTLLEKTYKEAECCEADVVLFGGQSFDDVTKEVKPMPWLLNRKILPEKVPFSCKDADGLLLNAYSPAPWTKLFKSDFIKKHHLEFQPLQNSNDVFFVFSATSLAERISCVEENLVYYRRGMSTNLQSVKKKAPLCFLEAYSSAYKKLNENGVYEYVKRGFRGTVISGCLYNYDSYNDHETKQILLDAFLSEQFNEMDLFGGEKEDYINYKKYEQLKLLVDAHAWKKRIQQGITEENGEKEKKPGISVIIPIANAQDDIEPCIRSIQRQKLKNIEIICVNQKSEDASWDIIYTLQLEDKRIKAYWQESEAVGAARSYGFRQANGRYVIFLEPCNILGEKTLDTVYHAAKEKYARITLFAGHTFEADIAESVPLPKCVKKKGLKKGKVFHSSKDKLLLSRVSAELWTKLFRKDFLENEGIADEVHLQDTRYITMAALSTANKIYVVDDADIYYKEAKQKFNITEQDIRDFFDLYYDIYDELQKRDVYENVQDGFKNIFTAESVTLFNRTKKHSLKQMFVKELFSEKWKEIGIMEAEDPEAQEQKKHSEQYYCLQGLIKGYLWKERMDLLKVRKEFLVAKKAQPLSAPKVSVIVPCYNIQDYVGECLDSLIGQTLREIEIICVNDGSVDGTKDVLEQYAQKDERITIIEQENSGLSVARNVGVKNAMGEYICFVDSDDLLELYALEELYDELKKNRLDILFFDGDSFFETDSIKERRANYIDYYVRVNDYSGINDGIGLLCAFRNNSEYRQSACMQIVRREFFIQNELWFHPGIYHEDNAFTFKGLLCAERVAHVNNVYYLRRVIENSIMTSKKTFAHSYGYFISFLDMWDIAQGFEFSGETEDIIAGMLTQVINNAKTSYRELDPDEKYMFECLEPIERDLFFAVVANVERYFFRVKDLQEKNQVFKAEKAALLEEKKQLAEEIEQLTEEKHALERKCSKLKERFTAEKNANKKKQDELEKIKKSKSYKFAMRLSGFYWKIRKLFAKK